MAIAQVSNQLLRSQGSSGTTVAANYPITGDGSTQLPLGLAEDYRGADGESLTFNITDITDGHRVTISGIQGSSSFDVFNGQDGSNGVNGVNGADGQSVTFDITNIASGHRVTLSGAQGSASFDVMNGDDGVDGISPTFRFSESEDGVTVFVSGAQGEESFRLYNATGESSPYSAGANIDITDHVISGKDWTDEISAASANAVSQIPDVSQFLTKSSADTLYYPLTSNPSGYLTEHQSLTNYYQKNETSSKQEISDALDNKLDKTQSGNFYPMTGNPSDFLTAHQSLSDYYQKNETSSKQEIQAAFEAIPGAVDYSAGQNINITNHVISGKDWSSDINSKLDETTFTAYTAAHTADDNTQYSAGANINITNHVISGKDWSTEIANVGTATSAATTAWVENQNYLTAHQSLAGLMSASKLEYDSNNKISGYDGSAFAGESREIIPVIGDNGISVSEVNNNVVIELSSVAHDNTMSGNGTPSSPLGVIGGGGKTYTGVAPIVVNNNEDKISANCIELSAGNGIDSTKLALGVIEVSAQGGSDFVVTDGTSSYSALGFYEQTNDPDCYQIMSTANNGSSPGQSFGYTLPTQSRVFSADCVESAKNYTNSAISAHIMYVNYGALTAGTVTFADIKNCINNGGIVIPYEIKLPGTNYKIYNYEISGVANSTTGYTFGRFEAAGKHQYMVISSYNDGATTGCITADEKLYATPNDVEAVDRIVLVATSGDIPASGATDNKVYIVTGNS